MPAVHDLDPPSMTEEERLAKRRYQAWFAFETHPAREDADGVRDWVDPQEIVAQRARGWCDFHPEAYCHRCGRRNIWAWHAPEWAVLTGGFDNILCPVCFADSDTGAVWCLRRHVDPDTDQVTRLADVLRVVSSLGDDAERVARCVLSYLEKDEDVECPHLSVDDPITQAQLLTGLRPREWTVRCEDCGRTWVRRRNDYEREC
jgi:hypothetical protein